MLDRTRLRILVFVMGRLRRHRLPVRLFLRPLSKAPLISGRMKVLTQAFMGSTAFEIHEVDEARGRIGIGGVEEIMFGSAVVRELHMVLAERFGEEEKNRALYELGYRLCRWEVETALASGRWAPRALVPLMVNRTILEDVRSDPLVASFFLETMGMVSRLITDEGGWGHLEFELRSDPLRVLLSNSQEASWLGPSATPVCHLYSGIVAGYTSAITGERLTAREVECSASGAPRCVFEVKK